MTPVDRMFVIIASIGLLFVMINGEQIDIIDLKKHNLTRDSLLKLDLQNKSQLNQTRQDGFTLCFSYLNSGINNINLNFDGKDSLDIQIRFDCEPRCRFKVKIFGISHPGKVYIRMPHHLYYPIHL